MEKEPLFRAVRIRVGAVDKEQAVTGAMPLEDLIDDNLAARRMQTSLLGGLAGMALLLVSIGIYAVLSFTVRQRTQEIGVRVALGAGRRDVLKMIFLQGLRLFLAGRHLAWWQRWRFLVRWCTCFTVSAPTILHLLLG